MEGFSSKIINASRELSAKERIALKDTSDAVKLDQATQTGDVTITPVLYATVAIHNEKADGDKDYNVHVVIDEDGTKYCTGSDSFWNAFTGIVEEMEDSDETYAIKVYRRPSKNYVGRDFLTCSII